MDIIRNGDLKIVYDQDLRHYRLDPYPSAYEVESFYSDDKFYDTHSPPDWFDKEWLENRRGLWNAYYDYLIRIGGPASSVLDYGCGCGWFLDYYRRKTDHYFCIGVEPSQSAKAAGEAALGRLPIYQSIDDIERSVGGFDLIYLNLVLEHIVNPVELLADLVKNYLNPNGRVVIIVPNDMNPLQERLGYTGYISPVHVNYFTPATLYTLMRSAHLKITHSSATFPMELFPLIGLNYIGNDKLGRRCHWARLRWEKIFGWRVYNLYQKMYNRWGIGRELIFVGEKNTVGRKTKITFDGIEIK